MFSPPKNCPECGKPANRRQTLWGGWTCRECGTEVDRKGRRLED